MSAGTLDDPRARRGGSFSEVLRAPGLGRPLIAAAVCRLPCGMLPLTLLLAVSSDRGSFTAAGAGMSAYAAGLAGCAPVSGRLVDRKGARPVLLTLAGAQSAALLGLLIALSRGGPAWTGMLAAAAAGAASPPVTSCVRTLCRRSVHDEASRMACYSLDAICVEASFLAGPLLVSAAVLLGSAQGSLLVVAVTAPAAIVALALAMPCATPSRARSQTDSRARSQTESRATFPAPPRTPEARSATAIRGLLGPLDAPLAALLLAGAASAATLGIVEVTIAAEVSARSGPALVGPLLALLAAGSTVGGFAVGTRWRGLSPLTAYLLALAVLGAGTCLLPLAGASSTLVPLLFLAGTALAPATAAQSALICRVTPPSGAAEAFAWASTTEFVGYSGGALVAGAMVDRLGGTPAFLLAAFLAATAAGVCLLAAARWPALRRPASLP